MPSTKNRKPVIGGGLQGMNKASTIITETMTACLPEGSSLSFTEIVTSSFKSKNTIIAGVIMFDGLRANLRLNRWTHGWSHGWDSFPGGDCYLDDDGRWKRVTEQPDLFGEAV